MRPKPHGDPQIRRPVLASPLLSPLDRPPDCPKCRFSEGNSSTDSWDVSGCLHWVLGTLLHRDFLEAQERFADSSEVYVGGIEQIIPER